MFEHVVEWAYENQSVWFTSIPKNKQTWRNYFEYNQEQTFTEKIIISVHIFFIQTRQELSREYPGYLYYWSSKETLNTDSTA